MFLLLLLPRVPCRRTEYRTDRFVEYVFQAFLPVFLLMLLLFNKLARQRKAEDGKKKETKTYVRLEASKYLTAPISLAHLTPISNPIGWKRRSFRRERVTGSSRRSSLVPIRRMGVVGAWCRISGIHWRVRERVLAWSSAGEGESTGKIYFLFSKTFFFF